MNITVKLDGHVVVGAAVFFSPLSEDGYAAYGVTDGGGVAGLTTFSPGDGAASGSYSVRVLKQEETRNPAVTLPDPATDPDGYEKAHAKMVAAGKSPFDVKDLIPKKYMDYATSGLKAEVSSAADNKFTFILSSAP